MSFISGYNRVYKGLNFFLDENKDIYHIFYIRTGPNLVRCLHLERKRKQKKMKLRTVLGFNLLIVVFTSLDSLGSQLSGPWSPRSITESCRMSGERKPGWPEPQTSWFVRDSFARSLTLRPFHYFIKQPTGNEQTFYIGYECGLSVVCRNKHLSDVIY